MPEPQLLTSNELCIKDSLFAAGQAAACILGGERAISDLAYQKKIADQVAARTEAAYQDWAGEAVRSLMGQVAVLEAIILKHSRLLAVAKTDDLMSICLESIGRAQSELRKTWLAIDQIRNPKKPTQFIKTYVAQQLNQLKTTLEASHEPLAIAATERPTAGIADSAMETLGEIHRTEVALREAEGIPERLQREGA